MPTFLNYSPSVNNAYLLVFFSFLTGGSLSDCTSVSSVAVPGGSSGIERGIETSESDDPFRRLPLFETDFTGVPSLDLIGVCSLDVEGNKIDCS